MTLLDEIKAKCSPELLASRDSDAIAAAVNVGRVSLGYASREKFSMWAAKHSVRAKIEDHANNPASPLRSIALALLDVLRSPTEGIDFSVPDNQVMLGAWVASDEITQAQADELYALASRHDPVAEFDVRRAIWADDGSYLA
jgi:hypothetical protein